MISTIASWHMYLLIQSMVEPGMYVFLMKESLEMI